MARWRVSHPHRHDFMPSSENEVLCESITIVKQSLPDEYMVVVARTIARCERLILMRFHRVQTTLIGGAGFAGNERQELKVLVCNLAAACRGIDCNYSGALINGQTTYLVYCERCDIVNSEKYIKVGASYNFNSSLLEFRHCLVS